MDLETLIKQEIENIKKGELSKRVISFYDYKSKYAVLRPSVKIEVELTQGVVAKLDVTDYFEEEIQ